MIKNVHPKFIKRWFEYSFDDIGLKFEPEFFNKYLKIKLELIEINDLSKFTIMAEIKYFIEMCGVRPEFQKEISGEKLKIFNYILDLIESEEHEV